MNDQAVISGTYSDLKFVKSRGVAQVVIEVPIEQAQNVVAAFGTPMQASDVWVAVARLKTEQKPQKELTEGEKAKRHFEAMCQDEEFASWLRDARPDIAPYGPPREICKAMMGVLSANDIVDNPDAWHRIYNEFQYRNVRK